MAKFDIHEYSPKPTYNGLGEIDREIEMLENNEPDNRTKEYKLWVKHINHLFKLYNTIAKDKIFKIIK